MKKIVCLCIALLAMTGVEAQTPEPESPAPYVHAHRVLAKGYRGYAEVGGMVDFDYPDLFGVFELSTSHGYQFSPHFYLGAGVALHAYSLMDVVQVPVFGETRVHLLKRWVSPFLGMRAGYAVSENEGLYLNPMVGVRFGFKKHFGLNVSVGYTYQENAFRDASFMGLVDGISGNVNAVTVRVGFDF